MENRTRPFVLITLVVFGLPFASFLVSYLFVVGSSPGTAFVRQFNGGAAELLMTVSVPIHFIFTQLLMLPILLLFPDYFGRASKLIGLMPSAKAFIAGALFYAFLAAILCSVVRLVKFKGRNAG